MRPYVNETRPRRARSVANNRAARRRAPTLIELQPLAKLRTPSKLNCVRSHTSIVTIYFETKREIGPPLWQSSSKLKGNSKTIDWKRDKTGRDGQLKRDETGRDPKRRPTEKETETGRDGQLEKRRHWKRQQRQQFVLPCFKWSNFIRHRRHRIHKEPLRSTALTWYEY